MPAQLDDKAHVVHLTHQQSGATAKVHLFGATVISWIPAQSNRDYLWLSEKAHLDGSKAIRGGIPVCFPIFGPPNPSEQPEAAGLPQHGFARISHWRWDGSHQEDDQGLTTEFRLDSADLKADLRDAWPKAFEMSLKLTLSAKSLQMALEVSNTSPTEDEFQFQALLHSYLKVPNSAEVQVIGLGGLDYTDKTKGGERSVQKENEVKTLGTEIDRVYINAPDNLSVRSATEDIVTITKSGLKDAVVWNPGLNAAKSMSDFGPDEGWKHMLCVEPGNARERVTLRNSQKWQGGQKLTAHL